MCSLVLGHGICPQEGSADNNFAEDTQEDVKEDVEDAVGGSYSIYNIYKEGTLSPE